jgi:hypothetical protein
MPEMISVDGHRTGQAFCRFAIAAKAVISFAQEALPVGFAGCHAELSS